MKILHYLSHFSLTSETFIYDLIIRQQLSVEYDPYVVTHYLENTDKRPFDKLIQVKYELPLPKRILNKVTGNTIGKRLLNIIEELNPDVIHCHFAINAIKLKDLIGINHFKKYKIVITVHGTDVLSMPKSSDAYNQKLKELANLPNVFIIANSIFLKNELAYLKPKNEIQVLYNTFNTSFKNNTGDKKEFSEDTLKIISVGRLIRWKGHIFLIKAIEKILKEDNLKIELTIVGDGDEYANISKYITEMNLQKSVKMIGAVCHEGIPELLNKHDIYVQPSIYDRQTGQVETFGVAVLEAIAAGLPVIVTNTGGLPELVGNPEPPYIYRVNPESSDEIVNALIQFKNNQHTFDMNKKEVKYASILDKFSISNQNQTLHEIYNKAQRLN